MVVRGNHHVLPLQKRAVRTMPAMTTLLVAHTHAGMTTAAFADLVRDWLRDARHPQRGVPYT